MGVLVGCSITVLIALYHQLVDPSFLLSERLIRGDIWPGYESGYLSYKNARLQSITGNPNVLPLIAAIGAMISLFYMTDRFDQLDQYRRSVFGIVFILSIAVIMFSRSRDTIASVLLVSILYFVIARKKSILLFGIVTFFGTFMLNYQGILANYIALIESGNSRFVTWTEVIQDLRWRLIFGIGDPDLLGRYTALDSSYFKNLVQFGVGGLVLFIWYNAVIAVNLFRGSLNKEDIYDPILLLFLVLLASVTFSVSIYNFPFTFIYWMVFALAIVSFTSTDISLD